MVNFVLEEFEQTVSLSILGNLYSENIPTLTADAKATLYVSLATIKDVFKYQTDSNDVVNDAASDIKYFTDDEAWPVLNPANAMVDEDAIATANAAGAFPTNKLFVAHDFTRHLADELFGTHLGVDLFNNELELLNDIRSICGSTTDGNAWFEITKSVNKVSVNSTESGLTGLAGDAGEKYMTNENTTSENLGRILLSQMIGAAPTRFAGIDASEAPQSMPFLEGDIISFKLTIEPADGQKLITKLEADPDVVPRSYEIRLEIVSDTEAVKINVAVADDEPSA